MRHVDWQRAFELLQFIMQFVTVEVGVEPPWEGGATTFGVVACASLIFPAASAPPASPTMLVVSNRHITRGAIIHSLPQTVIAPETNLNRETNLDNTSECVGLDLKHD